MHTKESHKNTLEEARKARTDKWIIRLACNFRRFAGALWSSRSSLLYLRILPSSLSSLLTHPPLPEETHTDPLSLSPILPSPSSSPSNRPQPSRSRNPLAGKTFGDRSGALPPPTISLHRGRIPHGPPAWYVAAASGFSGAVLAAGAPLSCVVVVVVVLICSLAIAGS